MFPVKHLVSEIVDYAGLFPPAQLPLDSVIENYSKYLAGEFRWMLARLVLPVGKVDELESHQDFRSSKDTWKISALVPPVSDSRTFASAIQTIESFNLRHTETGGAKIDNVEIRASSPESIREIASSLPVEVQVFVEVPHHEDPTEYIATIAGLFRTNLFAKIRTGGVTRDLIPTASEVARFVAICAEHSVGMKATAGLHHPLRGQFRLTYEDNPDSATMFGYLNMFLAGCFAYAGERNTSVLERILSTTDSNEFSITEEHIEFDGHRITSSQIQAIRQSKMTTFGSCSFTEPTDELVAMGWIDNKITT